MSALRWLRNIPANLLQQCLPASCPLCGTRVIHGGMICTDCELDLPHLGTGAGLCRQCALPLPQHTDYCGHCLTHPPAFIHCVVPFRYLHPLDVLIHQFKYHRNLTCGRALTQLLAAQIQYQYQEEDWHWPELIVPVPLHWLRRWRRGFNQAEIIGADLARLFDLPLATHLCRRMANTASQKGLTRSERQQNLRRAFCLQRHASAAVQGKCVAIIDDVVTTTATTRALSRLLLKAGAAEVHVWALARTPNAE